MRGLSRSLAIGSLVGLAACSGAPDGWTSGERSRFVEQCVEAGVYSEGECNRHRRNYEGLGCTFDQAMEIAGPAHRYDPERATETC